MWWFWDWLEEYVWTIINSAHSISAALLIVNKIWSMNKFFNFSVSLVGSSSIALASIPRGIDASAIAVVLASDRLRRMGALHQYNK